MKESQLGTDEGQQIIEIWSKSIETQMHFNEMQVKSRQLGLTFVTAALGIGIILLSNGNDFSFQINIWEYELNIHVSVLLTAGAMLALQAVKLLDLGVYHFMLRGAVTFGEDFEKNCLIPMINLEKGMTSSISHFSRLSDARAIVGENGRYTYHGVKKVTAHDKIRSFYRYTQLFLLIATFLLLVFSNTSSFGNVSDIQSKQTRASLAPSSRALQPHGAVVAVTEEIEDDADNPAPVGTGSSDIFSGGD